MDNKGKKPSSNKFMSPQNHREWNDDKSDLNSMKLSKEELTKRLLSRQSHNMAIAKAELMERNRSRRPARSFSPTLTSKLRISSNKTIDDVLAESSAALALSQKVCSEEMAHKQLNLSGAERMGFKSQLELYDAESDEGNLDDPVEGYIDQEDEEVNTVALVQNRLGSSSQNLEISNYPLSPQGWENLNNTMQLVVKTCEALWKQLEEERMTRQRLHLQLQEQRSVITTLTAELLQIQEHQEVILRELHNTRASNVPYPSETMQAGAGLSQLGPHRFPPEVSINRAMPSSHSERCSGRASALSDSSIDMRQSQTNYQARNPDGSIDELDFNFSSRYPPRLNNQGKSKSALQLNRDQENMRYNSGYLPESSIMELLQNYHINDH